MLTAMHALSSTWQLLRQRGPKAVQRTLRLTGAAVAAFVVAQQLLPGGDAVLARQVAMHISFAAPEWISKDEVPAEVVDAERQIYLNSDELAGKPEAAKERIVEGMLGKRFYAAQPGGALEEQPWIHDPGQTVGKALAASGARAVAFRRFSVAE